MGRFSAHPDCKETFMSSGKILASIILKDFETVATISCAYRGATTSSCNVRNGEPTRSRTRHLRRAARGVRTLSAGPTCTHSVAHTTCRHTHTRRVVAAHQLLCRAEFFYWMKKLADLFWQNVF